MGSAFCGLEGSRSVYVRLIGFNLLGCWQTLLKMARRSSSKSWLDVSQSGGKSDSLETVSAAAAGGGGDDGGEGEEMVLEVVDEVLARYRNIRPARTATNAGKRFSIFTVQAAENNCKYLIIVLILLYP